MNKFKDTDRIQLGQLIRFKGHMLDVATKTINIDEGARKSDMEDLEELLKEWDQRGYPEGPDISWARQRIKNYLRIKKESTSEVNIPPLTEDAIDEQDIFSVIKNRRSVRYWKKKPVPREMIEKINDFVADSYDSGNQSQEDMMNVMSIQNNLQILLKEKDENRKEKLKELIENQLENVKS